MKVAVLGPGGVGGLVAGALSHAGTPTLVLARESTAALIAREGIAVRSVVLGDFVARPAAAERLTEPVDALVVATKATGLSEALERVEAQPRLVLPLLNGLDHLAVLRARFAPDTVLAGTIRVEADRPRPGVVVHTSKFLLVEIASRYPTAHTAMQCLVNVLSDAAIPARIGESEPQVMWSKLVRLNALACTTSAYNKLLGEIRSTPALRADLVASIEEGCAVARAENASIPVEDPLGELTAAHDTLGSSMQRDIAAGRPPELDAIPGSVLRAAARHGIPCPTIERLVGLIAARARVDLPVGIGWVGIGSVGGGSVGGGSVGGGSVGGGSVGG